MSSTTTFIDPSLFSHSTPTSFPSPAPSSSHDDDEDEQQPSHKRARTSSSSSSDPAEPTKPTSISEQRKEARAHRNRIAAQNSRDRRKAQFSYLERRVAELEEENRILRAAAQLASAAAGGPVQQHQFVSVVPPPIIPSSAVFPAAVTISTHEEQARAERERERERENEALKERIRTLEEGWGAVVKALAAQGLPLLMGGVQTQPAAAVPETVASETKPATNNVDMMAYTAFPSPAPSNASLDFDAALSASSSSATTTPTPTPTTTNTTTNPNTTRHLARVATAGGPSLARSASLQRVGWTVSSSGLGLNLVSTTALRRASAYQRALAMDKARRGEAMRKQTLRRSCGKFSRSRDKGRLRRK